MNIALAFRLARRELRSGLSGFRIFFASLARSLRERHALASAVLWGPAEQPLSEEIVAASAGAAVLCPKTTIADLVALARGSAVMVSGDTGPTHVASALGGLENA